MPEASETNTGHWISRRRGAALLGIVALGLLGIVLVVLPAITHGRMPGDTADGRFNEYLLEHFYLWMSGNTAGFWTSEFYFPFPLTIAFSDNHLGNGLVFAAFRALGFDREDAFRGWYLVGFIVNFIACVIALRRLGYGYFAVASGAFLFTFGLPVTAQEAHAQLLYRFGVPLAVEALIAFGARRRLWSLCAILFWTVWQFYCSIYTGYFLSLLLIAFAVSIAVHRVGVARVSTYWPRRFLEAWRDTPRSTRGVWLLAVLSLLGLLLLLFRPYLQVNQLYRFHRNPAEIESMLPRLASYVFSTSSRLWRVPWSQFTALPMAHEQAMFVGLAPFLAIAAAIMLRRRRGMPADDHFPAALGAILLIFALTLMIWNHTLYRLVEPLPGANAIRAVARIITIMLFPFAMLLASGLDALLRVPALGARAVAVFIGAFLVLASSYANHYVTRKIDWRNRLAILEARLPANLPMAPILMIANSPKDNGDSIQIDAMLLAQQRGWLTLDGYSANIPPGYSFSEDCADAARNIASGLKMLKRDSDDAYKALARRTVRVGYVDCSDASLMEQPNISTFAGPLPDEAMARMHVEIEKISVVDGVFHITLSLVNGSGITIPAVSTTGTPVRLSAKFVGLNDSTSDAAFRNRGFELRQDIVVDIAPGTTQQIDFPIPTPFPLGTYRIAVSMVQDGVAWFHDRGMPIAISHQTVTIDGAIRVDE